MSEFTTIQITKDLKEKLNLVKGENNLTYNAIIEKLLEQSGGVVVNDVVEIQREQTALTLKYWSKSSNQQKFKDITYRMLMDADVGDNWVAEGNPIGFDFVNSACEVIYKKSDDVLLMVEEVSRDGSNINRVKNIVHVSLF